MANKPANAVDGGFAAIFSDIVERHGGKRAFSPASLGIARMIAWTLAQDSPEPSAAKTVLDLEKLLPARSEASSKAWDLTKLTDRQLHTLDKLAAICLGEAPPAPLPRGRRSRRWYAAADLAALLDRIEQEGSGDVGERWAEAHGLLAGLLHPMITMCEFHDPYCAHIGRHAFLSAAGPTQGQQKNSASDVSERVAGNVVWLPPSGGIPGGYGK